MHLSLNLGIVINPVFCVARPMSVILLVVVWGVAYIVPIAQKGACGVGRLHIAA
jgi:hypothetical protein